MPSDLNLMGVYVPPLLAAWVFGMVAASLTVQTLNRQGLAAHFSSPPLTFVGLVVIYTILFGITFFPT